MKRINHKGYSLLINNNNDVIIWKQHTINQVILPIEVFKFFLDELEEIDKSKREALEE